MSEKEPHVCTWPGEPRDTWRCPSHMVQIRNGQRADHVCAASEGHFGDHCCIYGTRWRQPKPSSRRRFWRSLTGKPRTR